MPFDFTGIRSIILRYGKKKDTVSLLRSVFFDLLLGSGPSTDDGCRLMGNRAWTCAFRAEAKALATFVSFVRNLEVE